MTEKPPEPGPNPSFPQQFDREKISAALEGGRIIMAIAPGLRPPQLAKVINDADPRVGFDVASMAARILNKPPDAER